MILDPARPIEGLADSKTISERKRNSLFQLITDHALSWFIAEASVEEIDAINILQATLLAMQRAVSGLAIRPAQIWVDGTHLPNCGIPGQAIIKGDSKVQAISAASILAKVHRDRLMCSYQQQFPEFSFHIHKGYGTRLHLAEIAQFGILNVHRRSFNPVKKMLMESPVNNLS